MTRTVTTIAILVAALACSSVAFADDYYIDPVNGSDTSGDGSEQSPWKTVTFALTVATDPIDVVHLLPGTYSGASGEQFPLAPAPGVDLIGVAGRDETFLVGDGSSEVVHISGSKAIPAPANELVGLSVSGGVDGVRLTSERSETSHAVLTNSTITANSRAGVHAGDGLGRIGEGIQGLSMRGNRVTGNGYGIFRVASAAGVFWLFQDNVIGSNISHGVRLEAGESNLESTGDQIRDNGGVGLWQFNDNGTLAQSVLVNSTISGNAGGGLYAGSRDYCFYSYYYGYQCFTSYSRIGASFCVIFNNGQFGGALRSGPGSYGLLGATIAWGNAGLDNTNFRSSHSNIGTGYKSGPGTISADPRFVDAAAGDFRIHGDSPCVDASQSSSSTWPDFEGEWRGVDGNGDGLPLSDIGIDEFQTMVYPGGPAVSGQPFLFGVEAPPQEDGNTVFVLLSGARQEDGIPLPGSGGLTVDLRPDAIFDIGVGLLPYLNATTSGGAGQTSSLTIPSGLTGREIFYAGVSLDLSQGHYVAASPAHSFSIQ